MKTEKIHFILAFTFAVALVQYIYFFFRFEDFVLSGLTDPKSHLSSFFFLFAQRWKTHFSFDSSARTVGKFISLLPAWPIGKIISH